MTPDLASLPADWDPKPAARKLVRNKQTGDLGYLVKRSGKIVVRLDRPNQEILRPYSVGEWQDEDTQRPLATIHVARVAFEADRALLAVLGDHSRASKTWTQLTDSERVRWLNGGPTDRTERSAVYRAILGALEPFTRG